MTNDNRKKKVVLFVCHDLVGLLMLNGVIPALIAMGLKPVVFNTTNKRNRKFKVPTPRLVSMLNAGALEKVILPFVDAVRAEEANVLGYRQLAVLKGVEYHEIDDVNAAGFVDAISIDGDIIGAVSLRFLQVFEQPLIDVLSKKGFMWNLHSGLLDKYKGLLLPYRAIANHENEYGLTLHESVASIDEGGILDKGVLPLDSSKPVLDLYLDTVPVGTRMITSAVARFISGKETRSIPQETGKENTYYTNPTEEEFARFVEAGVFYIDPFCTVRRIADIFAQKGTAANRELYESLQAFLGQRTGDSGLNGTSSLDKVM